MVFAVHPRYCLDVNATSIIFVMMRNQNAALVFAVEKEPVLHPAQLMMNVAVYTTAAALGSAKHTRGPVSLPARRNLTVEVRYLIAAMVNAP